MLTVTTSWDDGDVLDERLVALLDKYGIKGTFYISKDYRKNRLSDDVIRSIAARYEIGAHTLSHRLLPTLTSEEKRQEIEGGKSWLEAMLGVEVPMFCYPAGQYDDESVQLVREAGYKGARTVNLFSLTTPENPFLVDTTFQVYPLPLRLVPGGGIYLGKALSTLRERGSAMQSYGLSPWSMRSFEAAAKAAFDIARKKGGIFHLWGHSWEIDQYGLWESLEHVLYYMSNRADCRYITNGEII